MKFFEPKSALEIYTSRYRFTIVISIMVLIILLPVVIAALFDGQYLVAAVLGGLTLFIILIFIIGVIWYKKIIKQLEEEEFNKKR